MGGLARACLRAPGEGGDMDEDRKRDLVLAVAEVGADRKTRLSCAQACALSEQNGISLEEIGLICDRAGIKISACRLGCFK